jgi:hypothetical protein
MVAIGLLLLVAKPWGGTAERARPSLPPQAADAADTPPGPASAGAAEPTPRAELVAALGRQQCHNPVVWRVVTHERSGSVETRSLFPISPVGASGPADLSITGATIYASQLLGLGYCIPIAIDPDVSAIERRILIWEESSAGHYTVVTGTSVQDQGLFNLGEAYLAPPIGAPAGTWPGGRYVFEIQHAAADGTALWFALDFAPIG